MSKFTIRFTIIAVALYLILCYVSEIVLGRNIWSQSYYLLFELCVCLCISKQGVYHCKFIKWTAYGILTSDAVVCLDNVYDIFPVNFMVFVPVTIIAIGLLTTTTLAIRHFIKVKKYKHRWENPNHRF
jgi:hypothetical protein